MALTVVIYYGIVNEYLLIKLLSFFCLITLMFQPLLCSVPYGLTWEWVDWLVLGVFFVV